MSQWDKHQGSMRCYKWKCPDDGKTYFIPGCWPVVISGDREDCICYRRGKRIITPNEKIGELLNEVEYWKHKCKELEDKLNGSVLRT